MDIKFPMSESDALEAIREYGYDAYELLCMADKNLVKRFNRTVKTMANLIKDVKVFFLTQNSTRQVEGSI